MSLHHYRIDDLITCIVVSFFNEKWKHFWCLTFLKFVNLHHELRNLNLYFPFESRLTFIAFIAVLFPKINNNLPYLSIAYIIYISYYIFLSYFFYNSFHFIFFLISFISMESEIVYNRYECFYIISRFSSSLYFVPEKEKKWKKKEIICNSKRQQQQPQQYCSLCWA